VLASNGFQAMSLLKAASANGHPYPLVLSDFGMPDTDGYTLAEWIKMTSD